MDEESRWWITLGHTPLINYGFWEATLSTLGHTPLIDDSFLVGWHFALRHSQFAFSRGSWWIRSCWMTIHWSITISESAFIGDTVTLLDTLHWDTLYSSMVDFWDDNLFWGIVLSSVMDLDFSLEHSHFRWFILGHSHLIHIHIARGFWFIWTMMRCFHFWHQE